MGQKGKGFAGRRGFEEQGDPRRGEERTLLACEHGVEVGAARGQHHLVGLDLLGAHMEHDVAEQPPLPHAVHADKGVVVVALGVVGDAVAIAVEELHTPFHGCRVVNGVLSLLSGTDVGGKQSVSQAGIAVAPDNPRCPQCAHHCSRTAQEQLLSNQKHHPVHEPATGRRQSLAEHKKCKAMLRLFHDTRCLPAVFTSGSISPSPAFRRALLYNIRTHTGFP